MVYCVSYYQTIIVILLRAEKKKQVSATTTTTYWNEGWRKTTEDTDYYHQLHTHTQHPSHGKKKETGGEDGGDGVVPEKMKKTTKIRRKNTE